jgi:hypothetical protein
MVHRENFAVKSVEHEHVHTIPIEKSPLIATEDIPAGLTDAVAVDRSKDNSIVPSDKMAGEASPSERGSRQLTRGRGSDCEEEKRNANPRKRSCRRSFAERKKDKQRWRLDCSRRGNIAAILLHFSSLAQDLDTRRSKTQKH